MFNEAQFSVAGYVATDPVYSLVGDGIPRLRMRVSWTTRRRDPATGEWADANTSWIWVTCWRRLADNLHACLRKGDPVILRGRLDVRTFVGKDEQPRTSVDVDASLLGHDLSRGVAGFQKVLSPSAKVAVGEAGDIAVLADDPELTPATDGAGAGDGMFDDSAIEALAKESATDADSVGAPF